MISSQNSRARLPAAAGRGDAMGMLAHERVGTGYRHAQADAADHRQIGQVVAKVGDLLIA